MDSVDGVESPERFASAISHDEDGSELPDLTA